MKSKIFLIMLAGFIPAALLMALDHFQLAALPPVLLLATRWLAIAGLTAYAITRRSLTTWIMASMIIGAEVGHDWPTQAMQARVLSQIFLQLIKTIIAPLLFATLVVGIANHSDLKQVGRMGIKALIYFEIVTTLA